MKSINEKDFLNLIIQNFRKNDKQKLIKDIIRIFILKIAFLIFIIFYLKNAKKNIKKYKTRYDIDFNYVAYENNIITTKILENSGWQLGGSQPYFINGLIRKHKPKNCLEIGVADGGSSILILNAIKDIPGSSLISLDLNNQLYYNQSKETRYRVNQYFPELTKNWTLLTGQQPHKFLIRLKMKFDFVFLDTAHSAPGEILNFIELLPFLNEDAIFVLHDILWHFFSEIKFFPSNVYLYPVIYGDKVLLQNKDGSLENMGAVFLNNNQEKHYLDYFFLLLSFWEYIPKDNELNELKIFIKKYYKKDIYLRIFETAVIKNKIFYENQQKNYSDCSFINQKHKFFKNLVYGEKM
jgi:predicted O-methyltransferase YrrM